MSVFFCPDCSDMVQSDGAFCPRCGRSIVASMIDTAAVPLRKSPPRPLAFRPGEQFAERFTVIEHVASGGMGVVYKAHDDVLEEEVALKLIQPSLADAPRFLERFRREVRLTRNITHPNIARVHDIGESHGVQFLSMQWIEGITLQQLLRQSGTLREYRALEIADKILLALSAAHERGVIHRDLKPSNVMIDRAGNVRVVDFGLALEGGVDDLEQSGALIGSPLYMAPEQRRIEPLDPRTDLYAVGLIVRELLTGQSWPPEPGLTDEIRGLINPVMLPLLERLLADNRRNRFADAEEARREVRRLLEHPDLQVSHITHVSAARKVRRTRSRAALAVVAGLALAAVLLVLLWPRPDPALLSGQAKVNFDRAMHYMREEAESTATLDHAINFLTRAADHAPDSALVEARLAEAYWRRFEKDGSSASRRSAERAQRRAAELGGDSFELHLARSRGYQAEGKFNAARDELRAAATRREDSWEAWSDLCLVYGKLGEYAPGVDACGKALAAGPDVFRVHVQQGLFFEEFGDHLAALEAYERAARVKPDSSTALNNIAATRLRLGRLAEGAEALARALAIEELPHLRSNLGTVYYMLERYDEALAEYERAIELDAGSAVYLQNRGDALLALGRHAEARDSFVAAVELLRQQVIEQPLQPDLQYDLGFNCLKIDDLRCARDAADVLVERSPDTYKGLFLLASVQLVGGELESGFDTLGRAVRLGLTVEEIDGVPELARFRADPRFAGAVAAPR